MPDISDVTQVMPLAALAAAALMIIVVDLVVPARFARSWVLVTAIAGLAVVGWYLWDLWRGVAVLPAFAAGELRPFGGAVVLDGLSVAAGWLLLATALVAVLLSVTERARDMSGYISLVLFAALGMMVLAAAADMMVLFVALEVLSLSLYALVAFRRHDQAAREGAFKYFLLGSVAAALLLYGFALIYGVTGATKFADVAAFARGGAVGAMYHAGFALVVIGFAFKLALAPFHTWAPDAYQGAPTPVTAFMAVGTKAAAFVALARFLWAAVPADPELMRAYMIPIGLLAAVSMLVGSLGAVFQTNLKRLLAYSGIAHAGYLFMPLLSLEPEGLGQSLFYLFAYLCMAGGAFAVMAFRATEAGEAATPAQGAAGLGSEDPDELPAWRGFYRRRPWLALAMALFFLSMAGMPPTAGFTGKLMLIGGGLAAGAGWLLAAMVASTGISAYVYLRVVGTLFRAPEGVPEAGAGDSAAGPAAGSQAPAGAVGIVPPGAAELGPVAVAWDRIAVGAALLLTVAGLLILGLFPDLLLDGLRGLLPLR
ncbi:MAG: NADH-quinone oxidoreductase subunit N [Limnochordales bacterium]|nr:NADH-quinone oxidoreductase subunit N [Limnochordales bacterium]